ncbi:unnamed protein product [Paramecium primaurelia]|uniref:Transmembrane protein n=1 Tax=Paramecium primaurelia TaxID=5886 RepID=A0A8S1L9N6_PARPR|nr:unnamed protein product [Paramecium primaurelia]
MLYLNEKQTTLTHSTLNISLFYQSYKVGIFQETYWENKRRSVLNRNQKYFRQHLNTLESQQKDFYVKRISPNHFTLTILRFLILLKIFEKSNSQAIIVQYLIIASSIIKVYSFISKNGQYETFQLQNYFWMNYLVINYYLRYHYLIIIRRKMSKAPQKNLQLFNLVDWLKVENMELHVLRGSKESYDEYTEDKYSTQIIKSQQIQIEVFLNLK